MEQAESRLDKASAGLKATKVGGGPQPVRPRPIPSRRGNRPGLKA